MLVPGSALNTSGSVAASASTRRPECFAISDYSFNYSLHFRTCTFLCNLQTRTQSPNRQRSGNLDLMVAWGINKTLLLSGYYDSKDLDYSPGLHWYNKNVFLTKRILSAVIKIIDC